MGLPPIPMSPSVLFSGAEQVPLASLSHLASRNNSDGLPPSPSCGARQFREIPSDITKRTLEP